MDREGVKERGQVGLQPTPGFSHRPSPLLDRVFRGRPKHEPLPHRQFTADAPYREPGVEHIGGVRSREQGSRSSPERVIEWGDLHCCEQACQPGLPGAVGAKPARRSRRA